MWRNRHEGRQQVLNVKARGILQQTGRRADDDVQPAATGKAVTPYFAIGFEEVGQMLAAFTPKRSVLIAALRQAGPLTVTGRARGLELNSKNVHADVQLLSEWLVVVRGEDGLVSVPGRRSWSI